MKKTCYMCDKPGKKTKEHVPPECFFPEQKDIPKGLDFRKNLITVPACDEHNLHNSKDDEYLKTIIALHWRNNQAGYEYSMVKIMRSFKLKEKKGLWDLFFGQGTHHQFFNFQGEELVTMPLDIARFNSEMDKIARGIYFYQFKQKAREKVIIFSRSLSAIMREPNSIMNTLAQTNEASRLLCILEPKYGENPDIFYYQFVQSTAQTPSIRPSGIMVLTQVMSTTMQLVFYDGFEVTARFRESALQQSNL
ncbi:MAG: hypothetical protein ABI947_06870 [Chloroflexota bacterium]